MSPLLSAAIDALNDGSSAGCDGCIVIGLKAYLALQKAVQEATGACHGEVASDDADGDLQP